MEETPTQTCRQTLETRGRTSANITLTALRRSGAAAQRPGGAHKLSETRTAFLISMAAYIIFLTLNIVMIDNK